MFETTVSIERPENTPLPGAVHLPVQIDQITDSGVVAHNRAFASDVRILYKIATIWWNPAYLVLQDDVLVDEQHTDPDSGASYRYRIVARPKNYEFSHQELHVEVTPGT